ncbi:C4-dicarboxylate-binding protein DctP [Consotaella salsifontis]|uniref:C4-dicarboxylate-binding protein DctP n=1 Tax=Consotaella salsifontis TaxID=1365950 RepID=A0A1T4MU55_9HYPH|nr:C4-dicarboxylate-binding protein DctP [Consotaella salsifontis]
MKLAALCLSALALLTAPALAKGECDPGEIVVKFSHVVAAVGHPKGDAANFLARRVNEEMNGRMCMEVFANGSLVSDEAVMGALLSGQVQLAAPSLAKLEPYTRKYRIFDLPFLFQDLSAVNRFFVSNGGKQLLGAMRGSGFQGLGYWASGLKQFSAMRPLVLPDDARNMTFRIQPSAVAAAMIDALDAKAKVTPFESVFHALQVGDVDGQENTWSNI